MYRSLLCSALFLALSAGCALEITYQEDDLPEIVDFNFHVKPILSDRCFACHGPDANKREADLRLDQPESAIEAYLDSGKRAIVPGSLRRSQVMHRITSDDPDVQMPPPESNLGLTEREIAILAKWIDQGAEYKKHWSLLPIEPQTPPAVSDPDWPKNPIDHFVLATLDEKGWTPNAKADKETLLRRVTLDLTGLPPTIEEIDAFLADNSEQAYERVVDRLLETDAYAERMALDWMDVARYADSHGYSQDGYRHMWPWRDWVIKAFNENMPFDQFVTWQLAGDLLPSATEEQRLATAFLRNQRINSEGGIVPAEYLVEYAAERTSTVSTAFMGMTMACAKCHDHKYDPISQREFYQFYAFFNNVNEAGLVQKDGNSGPQVLLTDAETSAQLDMLNQQILTQQDNVEQRARIIQTNDLPPIRITPQKGLQARFNFDRDTTDYIIDLQNRSHKHRHRGDALFEAGRDGNALKFTAHDGMVVDSSLAVFDRSDPFSFEFDLQSHQEGGDMMVLMKLGNKNQGYRGYFFGLNDGRPEFQMISAYPSNLFQVRALSPIRGASWQRMTLTYDGSGSASGIRMFVNSRPIETEIIFDQLTQSILLEPSRHLILGGKKQEELVFDEGHGLIDNLYVYERELSPLEIRMRFDGTTNAARYDASLQREHYLNQQDVGFMRVKERLFDLRRQKYALIDELPGVMVMDDLPNPRPAYVLERGQYDAPGEQVFPGTPASILTLPAGTQKNRLGIARWLLHKDHPLTARVTVNRYWQKYFGKGLVETTEDFGNQGALPTHPALLDWLAYAFRSNNWDVKDFQKLIVMSATYQQSSQVAAEQRGKDPDNDWYARGPSDRLSGEMLRDQALAASGLLVEKIGGPSVKPYQPEGLWSEKSFFSEVLTHYEPGTGDDLYRRSMYTFWRRTSPPPSMILFDAPTRDNCTVRRQQTNTPLQALVLLNDPQFVEAARVLAGQTIAAFPQDVSNQLTDAYRRLSGFSPKTEVLALLKEMYNKEIAAFTQSPEEASKLITTGEAPTQRGINKIQHAALTVVVNTMMSFDEVVYKR